MATVCQNIVSIAPTVLVVSPGPDLVSPASGAGTRLKYLSRGLSTEYGWNVITMVPADTAGRPPWAHRCYTFEQWSLPFLTGANPSFVRTLVRVLRGHDVDVVHTPSGVCSARTCSRLFEGAAVNYAAQNVEADHATDFVDPDLPAYKRVLGPGLIPWIERAWVSFSNSLTTVSNSDRESFIDRYDVSPERIETIPTGTLDMVELDLEDSEQIRERYGLTADYVAVFHGSYAHPPNEEAFGLIRDVLAPAMRERDVDVEFLLVGKGVPEFKDPIITTAGFVEDLFSVLNAADIAVVPIQHGGGTKTKVYDYVTLGLPMVTTEKGVEGIDLVDCEHAMISPDVGEAFIENFSALLADGLRREAMQASLSALADEWSWERSVALLDQFYRDVARTTA